MRVWSTFCAPSTICLILAEVCIQNALFVQQNNSTLSFQYVVARMRNAKFGMGCGRASDVERLRLKPPPKTVSEGGEIGCRWWAPRCRGCKQTELPQDKERGGVSGRANKSFFSSSSIQHSELIVPRMCTITVRRRHTHSLFVLLGMTRGPWYFLAYSEMEPTVEDTRRFI